MKKILIRICSVVLCVLLLIISLPLTSSADAGSRRTVKVGFFAFDGYHMQDAEGKKSGYGYDYLQHMLDFANWNYEYEGYEEGRSWSDMLSMLENGEIDLLTSAVRTPEREEKFAFSAQPIGISDTILTIKAGNLKYSAEAYEKWNGMRVGMLKGNSRNDSFREFSEEKNFTYVPVYYSTDSELKESLENGTIDAAVTSNLRQIHGEWLLAQFDPKLFYVITRKDDTELMAEVDYAIEQVQDTAPELQNELYHKYYSADNGDQIAYTGKERAFINTCQENGIKFSAIIDPDQRPYAYVENGEMKGILSDLCREIFRRTGLDITIEPISDRSRYQELKQNGEAAICCDFCTDSAHAEREGYVLTSDYYAGSVSRLFRKRFSGSVKTGGIVRDSLIMDQMMNDISQNVSITTYDSVQDCVDAVRSGKTDTAYLFTNTAQRAVWKDVTNQLNCVTLPEDQLKFALGVRKEQNYLLASVLDKAILSISDEDISELAAPYMVNGVKDTTLIGLFYDSPLTMVAGAVCLIFFFSMLVILMIVRRKQKSEEAANIALKKAIQEAECANRSKSDFLSRMSHDIRTPLNGIIGMTYLAKEESNPKKTADCLEKISTSSGFLLGLVNDILDMSKAENNRIELHPEPYPVEEFNSYIDAVIAPLCRSKNQNFQLDIIPMQDYVPLADPLRVNQIFFNLLSNAVKYTPEGGTIVLKIRTQMTEEKKFRVSASVSDNGIGISEEFQKVLFDPFTQEGRSDTAENRGSGLGLAIVRRMLELMNGTISVNSTVGKGSEFRLQMEFDCIPKTELASAVSSAEHGDLKKAVQGDEVLAGKHVLLCEDHPLNQEIARALLEEKKMVVEVAEDGKQGVMMFQKSPIGFFDVVLMDIRMPVMDGYEAVRQIRSCDRADAQNVPILAMTADAFADDVQKCLKAGMNGHVSKPVNPGQMYEKLKQVMDC